MTDSKIINAINSLSGLGDAKRIRKNDLLAKIETAERAFRWVWYELQKERERNKVEKCPECGSSYFTGTKLAQDVKYEGHCGCLAKSKPVDLVNHPPHYKSGGMESIDVIEAFDLGFCLGNVVKYVLRAGRKEDALQDLLKAHWYLEREIRVLGACETKEA